MYKNNLLKTFSSHEIIIKQNLNFDVFYFQSVFKDVMTVLFKNRVGLFMGTFLSSNIGYF